MATQLWGAGPTSWSMSRDAEGHREYKIAFQVKADSIFIGPAEVSLTSGLPQPGDQWSFGSDVDEWAWCLPTATFKPKLTKEAGVLWDTEHTFSTKPPPKNQQRCNDTPIEDPLLEPQKISGSFKSFSEEATADRFGNPIKNSCHEILRGPQVEFDRSKMSVKIEQNVPALQLPLLASMANTLNAFALWGLSPRCIKLSSISYERKFFGQCFMYFTRSLEFDVDAGGTGKKGSGFDRDILDEGAKVLHGEWDATTGDWKTIQINGTDPDPKNPGHFDKFQDRNGNACRVVLNGAGLPAKAIGSGNQFVCITAGTTGGGSPTDAGPWVQVIGGTTPTLWDGSASYVRGNIVTMASGIVYVATAPNTTQDPPSHPGLWTALGEGTTDKGVWNTVATYNIGDVVEGTTGSNAGYIHVEKYDESDFLLLGVPTDLESPLS